MYHIIQISTSVRAMNHLYTTVTPMPPVQILHQTSLALAIWVIRGMALIVKVSSSVTVFCRYSKILNVTSDINPLNFILRDLRALQSLFQKTHLFKQF